MEPLDLWRRWKAKRAEQAYTDDFAEFAGRPNQKRIRKAHDRQLHTWLASSDLHPVARSMAESELRTREAWRGPARWSVIIAVCALVLSVVSIIRSG